MAAASAAARASLDASAHALAGAAAAQLSTLALYPLDQVRFLLQVDEAQPGSPKAASGGEGRRHLGETVEALRTVARRHGLQALYRGVGPMLLVVSISQGLYFWAYEGVSSMMLLLPLPAVLRQLVRSLVAGVITVVATNPLWVATMRLRLPAAKDGRRGPPASKAAERLRAEGWLSFLLVFRLLAEILEVDGAASLWQGLGSSLWLTLVPMVQFCVYELLRALDITQRESPHPSGVEAFVMGAIAKGVATLATYPLQVAQSNLRLAGARQVGSGTPAALAQLYRDRGLRGLYAGFEAKVLQTVLNGALMMLTYEKLLEGIASIRS